MPRKLLHIGFILLIFSFANAQTNNSYFGLGVSFFSSAPLPVVSLQLGGPVVESLELRLALDTLFLINTLSADLLYTTKVQNDLKLYAGGGAGAWLTLATPGVGYDLHVISGLEYLVGSDQDTGIFGEVKPAWVRVSNSSSFDFAFQIRAGVNLHF